MEINNENDLIIPFGKSKGENIFKLYEDTKYLQWCKDQPWFKEKYANIYNIVVNQTISKNHDDKTPEHNKIQNLFLKNINIMKLFNFINKNNNIKINEEKDKIYINTYKYISCEDHNDNSNFMKEIYHKCSKNNYYCCKIDRKFMCGCCGWCFDNYGIEKKYENFQSHCENYKNDYYICENHTHTSENKIQLMNECNKCIIELKKDEEIISTHIEFECDFNWDILITLHNKFYNEEKEILIEIKPTIGDEYPTILRKMKYQKKLSQKSRLNGYKIILLLNNFNSINTTKDELIKIFDQSDIQIIFLEEININLTKYKSLEEENKILKEYLLLEYNIDFKDILKMY